MFFASKKRVGLIVSERQTTASPSLLAFFTFPFLSSATNSATLHLRPSISRPATCFPLFSCTRSFKLSIVVSRSVAAALLLVSISSFTSPLASYIRPHVTWHCDASSSTEGIFSEREYILLLSCDCSSSLRGSKLWSRRCRTKENYHPRKVKSTEVDR